MTNVLLSMNKTRDEQGRMIIKLDRCLSIAYKEKKDLKSELAKANAINRKLAA